MKKIAVKNASLVVIAVLTATSFISAAQQLPKVQEAGLRAPDNIKIDGKTTEWNGQFQAHNPATEFFYTMANDDKNLYLLIQVKDLTTIKKISQKGITLTIQRSGKKEYKDGMAITYPTARISFAYLGNRVNNPLTADSLTLKSNNLLQAMAKYIGVTGVKDIDTTISVYNEYGIKAVGLFDNRRVFTYELAVPLKVFGLSLNNAVKFAYNLRQNGNFPLAVPQMENDVNNIRETMLRVSAQMAAPTDVWGEYTLVKK